MYFYHSVRKFWIAFSKMLEKDENLQNFNLKFEFFHLNVKLPLCWRVLKLQTMFTWKYYVIPTIWTLSDPQKPSEMEVMPIFISQTYLIFNAILADFEGKRSLISYFHYFFEFLTGIQYILFEKMDANNHIWHIYNSSWPKI